MSESITTVVAEAYLSESADGGVSWTAPVNIADATSGAAYKTAAGSRSSTSTRARS
ncbi:MAG: hypothetical protein H0W97_03285 [Actinobacteria bacterium]|nr:hypothetical protein [Actinomycetota bacterium]